MTLGAVGLASALAAGLIGQAIRDRSVALALLLYLPLLPVGLMALVLDLTRSGRALPRVRFGLSLLGGVGITCSFLLMTGRGTVDASLPIRESVGVLHWNVQWGGGRGRSPETWAAQRAEILRHAPDLVLLSEAPPDDWLRSLVADLGPGAASVLVEHDPGSPYWFRLAACSRGPIRLEERLILPDGAGMSIVARVRGQDLRVLLVDGPSNPLRSRTPFLRGVAALCREAEASGRPYQFVAGDFNSPGRCLGFDAIADQGYRLASRSSLGWRATFPARLPLLDIDHIWLGRSLTIRSCLLFRGPYTDHRGQVVRVQATAGPRG